MEKIINRLIDEAVVDVDKYVNNNSTWLIFTESKQWVIELTKDGTLWYNYNFFKNLFVYMSMDVVENQQYITKWVEDNIINGVKETRPMDGWVNSEKIVGKTIQNGVIAAHHQQHSILDKVEYAIQNGVKDTYGQQINPSFAVEDTIQNGVKDTRWMSDWLDNKVENTIQNGVKHTEYGDWEDGDERLDDIIQNGVKHIEPGGYLGSIEMKGKIVHQLESPKQNNEVEEVIQHGVIETFDETHHRRREVVRTIRDGIKQTCAQIPSIDAVVERVVEEGIKQTIGEEYHHRGRIDGAIKNCIKEVQPLPAQDGNMDWGNYYHRQEDRTKPHTQYVNDVIENSIRETIL